MAQQNFPIMISVDWLTLSIASYRVMDCPANSDNFVWEERKFGTKQFKHIFDVSYVDTDGALEPFGVFASCPTLESWSPMICSLKLDNHLLYRDNRGYWLSLLRIFLEEYWLTIRNISRCDLAGDFLYLQGRLSGPQLCRKIKSFQWWKCGSVNISEHYKMPYSLEWQKFQDADGIDTKTFKQQGGVDVRVETLTFGTMSSDAQVCIYDKTLELSRSEVEFERDGKTHRESAKEYIRDCHKAAGVWNAVRHTWRIEIRLRNKALFVTDPAAHCQRSIELGDLEQDKLAATFLAAADRYLRLVDATRGGSMEITADYIASMNGHKNRLPIVKLFSESTAVLSFAKKPYHEAANRFHRAVITRLEQLGDRMKRVPAHYSKPDDPDKLHELMDRLEPIAQRLQAERKAVMNAKAALNALQIAIENSPTIMPEDLQLVNDAREVIERHFGTESPIFCRNIVKTLEKYSERISRNMTGSTSAPLRKTRGAKPADDVVLLEAASILKGIFVNAVHDERRADNRSIYLRKFVEGISVFNAVEECPPVILDMLYTFTWSKHYISDEDLQKVLLEHCNTDFHMLVTCNFDIYVYSQLTHHRGLSTMWVPPLLPRFQTRDDIPCQHYSQNIHLSTLN